MMEKPIIAYEGILNTSLGLLTEKHFERFAPWANKRTDISGTLQRPPYYPEMGIRWLKSLQGKKGTHEVFAVFAHGGTSKRRTYRYIGHTGISDIEWPRGNGITGSVLGATGARGNGHGTEAKIWLLYHGFMILGLRKVSSEIKAFNAQSLGHLIKCGYRYIGRRRAHDLHEGAFVDSILLECFREDREPIWHEYLKNKALPKLSDEQRSIVSQETNQ